MFKNNIIFKILRFITGYKTIQFNLEQNTNSVSVSDLFCFRTDNNFKTIFRYTDLLNLFYNIKESQISLKFYDNNYNMTMKRLIAYYNKYKIVPNPKTLFRDLRLVYNEK